MKLLDVLLYRFKGSSNIKLKYFLLLALIPISMGIYFSIKQAKNNSEYFDDLNLKLVGVVESVDLSYIPNGFGVVKVNIIETNKDSYDPRNNRKYYYCLIKNNKAEFYQHGLYECATSDTIYVDTKKRTFQIRNGSKKGIEDISLMTFDKFFDYVRKKHQKF